LRRGEFDVLVGINLLREGLDIPEVSLVAVLDADKEGFLRSTRSLIQTCGRAARNVNGRVILYAETVTPSMARALEETDRRRRIQQAHNRKHGITPETIRKAITETFDFGQAASPAAEAASEALDRYASPEEVVADIRRLEAQMHAAARDLDFEQAADLRDRVKRLQELVLLET
jgi:excinuclease ABC subunit B